jgi:hypothetical protein
MTQAVDAARLYDPPSLDGTPEATARYIDQCLQAALEHAGELRAGNDDEFAWILHRLWEQHRPTEVTTPRRLPVPKWLRRRIMERDEYACVECGATENLQLDHIVPHSKMGPTRESNLRVLCGRCNVGKRDR